MAEPGTVAPVAAGLPLTKFRTPRPRRDFVPREALVQRLRGLVEDHPVTLVTAPAGSGKTTLMVQLAGSLGDDATCIWIALDDSDDDPSHLLASLVHALLPLPLRWMRDPHALVANATGGGSEARAVLAGIVNALCTAPPGRVVWMLDDLHRVSQPEAIALLESLIERLPEHVALVLGSRTEPPLPLARLRAHGELGELDARALRFDDDTVRALARARWGAEPPGDAVRDAMQRTRGWAVGVNLLLAARQADTAPARTPRAPATPRALFDFLVQEVLDELPERLRRFAVDCAVLADLSPARCQAVTLEPDSAGALEELLRRHLFLSVVDEQEPVLRFHDLFRDFLRARLDREPPEHRRLLHERAAAAETLPERAIGHWLDAGDGARAAALLARHGHALAEAGAYASVERWVERLPPEVLEADPRLALMRAECAWSRWDWERVMRHAEAAAAGLARAGDAAGQVRAQLLHVASLGALGWLEERERLTEAMLALDLPPGDAAQFHLQRAWSDFSLGRVDRVAGHLRAMNDLVAQDPAQHAPVVAQTLNCHFGGLPGVAEAWLHYAQLCALVPQPAAMPWHSTPVVLGAWAALWQGRRGDAEAALARSDEMQRSFGRVRYVALDALHLQTLLRAARGDVAGAREGIEGLLADLATGDAGGLRRVWLRPYRGVLARVLWMAQDRQALGRLAAEVAGPLRAQEWPLVATLVDTVCGQAALLEGDLDLAIVQLERAVAHQAHAAAPAFHADPRVALASARLAAGEPGAAWTAFAPVLQALARDRTPGTLVLEPRARVQALLDLAPRGAAEAEAAAWVRDTLQAWHAGPAPVASRPDGRAAAAGDAGPVGRLTDREREVLKLVAQGLPNKVLARQLSLSAHTVKRHLANILDKLDCDNRGQAADLWRRAGTHAA